MQTHHYRMSCFAVLTLFTVATLSLASQAQERQPVEVLKANGLKRAAGSTWLLLNEAVILKDVREAAPYPFS